MVSSTGSTRWLRRARPLLGTLVDIGVPCGKPDDADAQLAIDAAFARVRRAQDCLSRFDASSDIGRFHALRAGESIDVRPDTEDVLMVALELHAGSGGVFDISLGTAPRGWHCERGRLHKTDASVRLDLGGIGKGHAVDCAVQCLIEQGCEAGWVNAGGDLRSFGDVDVPVMLRDEAHGGVRPFASLRDGSFATSRGVAHTSVAAPLCIWADALNKIVALTGDAHHPVLARYEAQAWIH